MLYIKKQKSIFNIYNIYNSKNPITAMILDKNITIEINPNNIKHYKKVGYEDIKIKDKITIDINKLPINSRKNITVKCCNCDTIKEVKYCDYIKSTLNKTTNYYCKKCKNVKIKETVLNKYGVENVFQLKEVKDKIKETSLKKYKKDHYSKTDDFINKIKTTNLEKYNVEFVQQNKEVRQKTEETNIIKYGFKTSLLNNDVKIKVNNTMLDKYGVLYPLQNEEIKNKNKKTRKENILNKYNDLNIISIKSNLYTIMCDKGHIYQIDSCNLYHRKNVYNTILCTMCNNISDKQTSGLETELYEFIKENYNGNILKNDRTVIKKELDIYLPEMNLAFEFNGLYWHNELNKPNNYHKEKSDLCDKYNIQLIHIWEDEWVNKKDIIKSMILNKLKRIKNRIYARKCEIREITSNDLVRYFLDKNHIQGFVGSSIKIGLYYNEELVSLMTFGKTRKNMNSTTTNKNEYELLRFCNKLNTNVIGGASKLFKYFLNNYKYDNIVSYADRSHSNGNLYEKLGFKFIHITVPNYYYVINKIRVYRFNFRKDILVKQGFDKNKSEHDIMLERKIFRIYNAGNYKFVYSI